MIENGVGIKNPLFFIGVVENEDDPRKEGRVQVRAFGVHGTNKDIPSDELPWAICVQGDYNPNNIPPLNAWVFGVFLDGRDCQQPMVLGLIPTQHLDNIDPVANGWGAIPKNHGNIRSRGTTPEDIGQPNVSRLARGEYTQETYVRAMEAGRRLNVPVAEGHDTWNEPSTPYGTQYPFNRVIQTANHSIELDDTPGAERITVWHKSGSYVQIDTNGTFTEKAVSDKYEINERKQHVVVGGTSTVTILGNSYVYVKGNKVEEIQGDLKQIVHGNHILSVGGQLNLNGSEQIQIRAGDVRMQANVGTLSIHAAKELQTEAGIGWYAKAPKIWAEATDTMNIKANELFMSGTTSMDLFADKTNIQGVSDINIFGDSKLQVGSGGKLSVQAPNVAIDDFVSMANGDSAPAGSAFEAEGSISATQPELPEPPEKSTSIVPSQNAGSVGSSGIASRDHAGESTTDTGGFTQGTVSAEMQSAITPLLDFIGNKESRGYDDMWRPIIRAGKQPSKPLTQMTIQEILDWQESIDSKFGSEAAGRYQILEDTLRGYNNQRPQDAPGNPLYARAGLSTSDLFSPINQDKLAAALIEGRGLSRFLNGTITREEFANNLAAEWASLPLVSGPNTGKSYYAGDSVGNQALTDVASFLAVLDQVKSYSDTFNSGDVG